MPPADYKKARADGLQVSWVDDRPYLPELRAVVDCDEDDASVKATVAVVLLLLQQHHHQVQRSNGDASLFLSMPEAAQIEKFASGLSVERVCGGITNTLYKVSGCGQLLLDGDDDDDDDASGCAMSSAVLLRVFGAEGMIDRDHENSVYAALSAAPNHRSIAPPYFGRFANGRVEGWMDGMRPLETSELGNAPIARGIGASLATLHFGFEIPADLYTEPSLWTQLYDWLDQAERACFQNEADTGAAASLELTATIRPELTWLKEQVVAVIGCNNDAIVFCHNDLLAANILYDSEQQRIQLIDFEYGGVNYRAFDIANHFNEYAGGPPDHSTPDYGLLPSTENQRAFIRTYLETAAIVRGSAAVTPEHQQNGESVQRQELLAVVTEEDIDTMMLEVEIFLLANHFYWGLWAVNQAATEGCSVYDYMTYAVNRIQQYWITKRQQGR